uniref:Mannosylglycerate hydrolase MGH1-like glycoside hydrolase domain-containing protein n=1 Tax=Erythrolobus madagascarensis TaxID=708628 RepID=A0A7S0XJM5_9RHOD|mmetsp:Transcript_321/g.613  ORF Transcript_321/g.613 Transcript_321/m.613 type:complete len:522 (+) Transcript_321:115-1680(+)
MDIPEPPPDLDRAESSPGLVGNVPSMGDLMSFPLGTPSRSDIMGIPDPYMDPNAGMLTSIASYESIRSLGFGFSQREPVRDARQVLKMNDRGDYCVPSARLYPYSWNWDASFTAMGWASWKPARAWAELETLFRGQWMDGMLPSIVFHRHDPGYFPGPDVWRAPPANMQYSADMPRTTGITQPPIVASCVRQLVEKQNLHETALVHAHKMLPKLVSYHEWFFKSRMDDEGIGRVAIHHPWESGMDNSPSWDEPLEHVVVSPELPAYERKDTQHVDSDMRPTQKQYDRFLTLVLSFRDAGYEPKACSSSTQFRVADVCVNAILLRANKDLLWLCTKILSAKEVLDLDSRRIGEIQELQVRVREWINLGNAALDSMWSDEIGTYCAYDEIRGKHVNVSTSAAFLALYGGHASRERATRLTELLSSWLEHVKYGVPSVDPSDEKLFDAKRYWRGPVWLVVNWMISEGLERYEYYELAERVRRASRELIKESGHYEYFDPSTGAGCGGPDFSWTAAIALAWFPDL